MARAPLALERITAAKVLLVEGWDEKYLYEGLLKALQITNVQVITFEGKGEAPDWINLAKATSGFEQVEALGIVLDADGSPAGTFRSVCNALRKAGFVEPAKAFVWQAGKPRTGVIVQPSAAECGALESLCLAAVKGHPLMTCIDQLFECIREKGTSIPSKSICKAKAHAFLAIQEKPGKRIGEAGAAGYWNWDSPVWNHVKSFLGKM